MVCTTCENKLSKVACPDKWKDGSRNTNETRKIGQNKLLSKSRFNPYAKQAKCQTCKATLHQEAQYCQSCAYVKGICAMCGKQILDTSNYKQSMR
eukprot:jgi/Botrbrau1/8522/Bobra.0029s0026.1